MDSLNPSVPICRRAVRCAKRGWSVIPLHGIAANGACTCKRDECGSQGKHPASERGYKDGTKDVEEIERLFEGHPRWNFGIGTGKVSDIVVLDVDPRNGGVESLMNLQREIGLLPPTWEVETGGGGTHLYYSLPGGVELETVHNLGGYKGLDFQAEKALVVGVGSRHKSGAIYKWKAGRGPKGQVSLAQVPPTLMDLLKAATSRNEWKDASESTKSWLPATLENLAEGSRHTDMVRVVSKLRNAATPEDLKFVLRPYASASGMPQKEFEEVVEDNFKRYDPGSKSNLYKDRNFESDMATVSARELLKMPDEPVDWLVKDILQAGDLMIVSGAPGGGKSWLALGMALDMTLGRPWLGEECFKTRRAKVLYIDEENGENRFKRRLRKLKRGLGVKAKELDTEFLFRKGLTFSPSSQAALDALLRDLRPDVVVMDSLVRFLGDVDENKSGEMAVVFAAIRGLMEKHGCAFVLLDHTNKGDGASAYQRLRGSGEKSAAVDCHLSVKKMGQNTLEISQPKQRDQEELKPFCLQMFDIGTLDRQGLKLNYLGPLGPESSGGKKGHAKQLVLDLLKPEGVARAEILAAGKEEDLSSYMMTKVLDQLEREGEIRKKMVAPEKGRGAKTAVYFPGKADVEEEAA